jgi:competence protein ComEC
MAYPQGADFRKPQGHRRLARAQVAGLALASFLTGVWMTGVGVAAPVLLLSFFAAAAVVYAWKNNLVAALILPLACAFAIFYYHFYFDVRADRAILPSSPEASFIGMVSAEPGHSAKSEYFPLRLTPPFKGKIRVVTEPGSGFHYGDVLELRGRIESPEKERDLPVMLFPKIVHVDSGRGSPVRQWLFGLKGDLLDNLPFYLPPDEAAFLGGITLGAKADFSPEFIEALAASGTTHLIALSGYNIAILVFVVFGACLALVGRRGAFYITTISILLFVLMVGAEPSVVRAAIMGCLILLARELGRPYSLIYGILWTAVLMVLFDPGALFMPGFQLSFMALLGIVYLSPVILKWLGGTPSGEDAPSFLGGFRENAALTISAQIAVAPIVLNNFGGVSLTSVLANAFILPFMPMTMFFGFSLILSGSIFAPLGVLVGLAGHVLLAYELAVIRIFADINLPVTGDLSWHGVVIYYFLLATLARTRTK